MSLLFGCAPTAHTAPLAAGGAPELKSFLHVETQKKGPPLQKHFGMSAPSAPASTPGAADPSSHSERRRSRDADGDAVTVVPIARELTTQQAADMLQVSRQYLVRLLDAGELPCRKTGSHRRIRVEDVTSYKAARDARRRVDLRLLTAISEQSGGYEGEPA